MSSEDAVAGRDAQTDVSGGGPFEAVIFDFDGLLMDTESTSIESWRYEWQQWGLELDTSSFFVNHGGDITESRYADLAAAVGDAFDRKISHRRRVEFRNRLHESLDPTDGMRDWIDQAVALDLRLAVASSSPLDWLEQHLGRAGIFRRFDVLAAGDEVEDHKPAPDVYELALTRLGIQPCHAVAIEDTAHGVDAAHGAGLRCIAIPNPFVGRELVRHADLVLPSAASAPLEDALSQIVHARPTPRRRSNS